MDALIDEFWKVMLAAILAQVVGFLFIIGRLIIRYFMQKLEASKYAFILEFVRQQVLWAEQTGLTRELKDQIVVTGREKLNAVVNAVVNEADKRQWHLDGPEITKMVEATVMQEFGKEKITLSLKGK